jgi:hypothetical protein
MEERLSLKEILQLLGYPERDKIENGDVLGSEIARYPARLGRLAAALAAHFAESQIDAIAGFGYMSALFAAFVAQNLSGYGTQPGVAAVPLWSDPTYEGSIVISWEDEGRIKGKRLLVVAGEASRVVLIKRVSDFCRSHGAAWIAVGLIANFGCNAPFLGADEMVRSLVLEPSI